MPLAELYTGEMLASGLVEAERLMQREAAGVRVGHNAVEISVSHKPEKLDNRRIESRAEPFFAEALLKVYGQLGAETVAEAFLVPVRVGIADHLAVDLADYIRKLR